MCVIHPAGHCSGHDYHIYSICDERVLLTDGMERYFIGLKNFTQMFAGSSDFVRSLVFTGKYTVLFMLFTNVLAIAAAVALV